MCLVQVSQLCKFVFSHFQIKLLEIEKLNLKIAEKLKSLNILAIFPLAILPAHHVAGLQLFFCTMAHGTAIFSEKYIVITVAKLPA